MTEPFELKIVKEEICNEDSSNDSIRFESEPDIKIEVKEEPYVHEDQRTSEDDGSTPNTSTYGNSKETIEIEIEPLNAKSQTPKLDIMYSPTSAQVEELLNFLEDHPELARGQLRNVEGRILSQKLWIEISNKLNAMGGRTKTVKQWQKPIQELHATSSKPHQNGDRLVLNGNSPKLEAGLTEPCISIQPESRQVDPVSRKRMADSPPLANYASNYNHIAIEYTPPGKKNKRKSKPNKVIKKPTSKPVANKIKEKSHNCHICNRNFFKKHHLVAHLQTHTGERPYLCTICNKKYRTKYILFVHKQTHLGLKPFECNQCEKSYTSRQQLNIHLRIHSGEKPFICDTCNKEFKDKWKLKLHIKTHSGLKPYGCDKCEKKYTTKYQLTIHYRTHTGEKLFACEICTKKFTERCKLKLHEKTHLNLKPYLCDLCDKKYRMKSHLKFHIESIHSYIFAKRK